MDAKRQMGFNPPVHLLQEVAKAKARLCKKPGLKTRGYCKNFNLAFLFRTLSEKG